jgi:GT2 family glycosyltransferase
VPTVPFGCYRRETFTRYGVFDEDLVRAQDEEFNFRVSRRGGRILLVPDVVAVYFARRTLHQVARMYYQYGYFKPWVAQKVGRVMTVRQLVPAAFLTALVATAVGGLALAPLAGWRTTRRSRRRSPLEVTAC